MDKARYWGVAPATQTDRENRAYGIGTAGQTTFNIPYAPGYLDFYLNHVKLAPTDFTANDGATVVLNDPLLGGEFYDIIGRKAVPVTDTLPVAQAATVARVQSGYYNTAVFGGAPDALTMTLDPVVNSLARGMMVFGKTSATNVTVSPTLQVGTTPAKGVVKGNGVAVAPGDFPLWPEFQYDDIQDKWVLQNPVSGTTVGGKIFPVSASVSANALTLGVSANTLDFRSSTQNSGAVFSNVQIPALSLVVPNTATLGTVNGVSARLIMLVAYNAGSPVLCVANLAGGLNLDETTLISPTTISTGATSANVIYSASTVAANSPFRVVGFCDISEATAGTWATGPITVQGVGGEAISAMSSIGFGQTVQGLNGSRAMNTTYYNTTGKPIFISVIATVNTVGAATTISVNGVTYFGGSCYAVSSNVGSSCTAIIPPGGNYSASTSTGTVGTILGWIELR